MRFFSLSCDTSVGIFGTLPVFVASVGTYSYTLDSEYFVHECKRVGCLHFQDN